MLPMAPPPLLRVPTEPGRARLCHRLLVSATRRGPGGAEQVGEPGPRHRAGAKLQCGAGKLKGRHRRQSHGEKGTRGPGENLSKLQKKGGNEGVVHVRGLWLRLRQSREDTESSLSTTYLKIHMYAH